MNTLEMIFTCSKCELAREYGTAANFRDLPDNLLPTIHCIRCHKPTVHQFKQVMQRTDNRERKVFSEMRTSAMSSLL